MGKGVIETLTPLLQSMLLSDFDILLAGEFPYTAAEASLIVSELFSLPAIIQANSNLAWQVV